MAEFQENQSKFMRKAKENPFVPVGKCIFKSRIDDNVKQRQHTVDLVCLLHLRFGWILRHCGIQADENEKSRRYENVCPPDPHACCRPGLCGRRNDIRYVYSGV